MAPSSSSSSAPATTRRVLDESRVSPPPPSSSSSSAPATTRLVLDESRVSPPPGSVPPASLPLTSFDLVWLALHPVNRLFFYRFPHPSDTFITSHLPTLKSSLSLTLQIFYPLAGNVRLSPGSDTQFEIHYADGDAVAFTVVESDDNFEELSAGHPRELARIHQLVPELSAASRDARPLLAILITVFPDCGICIGVTIHHAACDGSSSVHFLKSWASACRSGGLAVSTPPLHDRTLVSTHTSGLYSIYYNQLKELMTGSDLTGIPPGAPPVSQVLASFTLRQDQIQKLKQRVMAGGKTVHCSTFIVTCAYVWVCLAGAKGYASEKTAHFAFVANVRGRLDPPVPEAYFGNCLGICFVEANAGELISGDCGGVVPAAVEIGKAVEGLSSGGGVMRCAEGLVTKLMSVVPHQPISVAGSPKFRVYDTDFGWGRPVLVEIPSIAKGGAISLAEARDNGGGVEIGVALEKHEMDEFKARFYKGL